MEIRRGVIKSWDLASYTASIQLDGSLTTALTSVNVARDIADAEMVAGRYVLVAMPNANPDEAIVSCVYA